MVGIDCWIHFNVTKFENFQWCLYCSLHLRWDVETSIIADDVINLITFTVHFLSGADVKSCVDSGLNLYIIRQG